MNFEKLKFIITRDFEFRAGLVETHAQLKGEYSDNDILGGGSYFFDKANNKFYLYGKSIKYGKTNLEAVSKAIVLHLTNRIDRIDHFFSTREILDDAMQNCSPIIKYELGKYGSLDILIHPETNRRVDICCECGEWQGDPCLEGDWDCYKCSKSYKLIQ